MAFTTSPRSPLDPAELAALILAAEEGGRVAAELAPRGEARVAQPPPEEPLVYTMSRVRIPGEVLRVGGSGTLEELVILSLFSDYRVRVVSGGRVLLDAEWGELRAVSPFVTWISAYTDDETGFAVLGIGPLAFSGGLVVRAAPTRGRAAYLETVIAKLRVRQ